MTGFAPSMGQLVEVRATSSTRVSATLQRSASAPSPSAQPPTPPPPPKIIAAGLAPVGLDFDPLAIDSPRAKNGSGDTGEDGSEKDWRIRHLPRSVLKTTTERTQARASEPASAGDAATAGAGGIAPRAKAAPARLLRDLPLTGQVNLTTSGSLDGGSRAWSSDSAARGSAFLTVAGPGMGLRRLVGPHADAGDLGSWFLSGSFRNRAPARHVYNVGFSYSTQRTTAANPLGAARARADGAGRPRCRHALRRRPGHAVPAVDRRLRCALLALRLSRRGRAVQPERHGDACAFRSVPRPGRRVPAPARARCGGVPGAADLRDVGPAREDLCRLLAGGA